MNVDPAEQNPFFQPTFEPYTPENSPFLADRSEASPPINSPFSPPAGSPTGPSNFPSSSPPLSALPAWHHPPPSPSFAAASGSLILPDDPISTFTVNQGAWKDPMEKPSSPSGVASTPVNSGRSTLDDLRARLEAIQVTTTDGFQGRLTEEYLGPVVAGIVVFTTSILQDNTPSGRFGRCKSSQGTLRALQDLALAELRMEASRRGANAVVGCNFGCTPLGERHTVIQATGTAVRLQ